MADDEAAMVKAEVVIAGKLLESRVETGNDGGAPSEAGRKVAGKGSGGRVGSVGRGPSGR